MAPIREVVHVLKELLPCHHPWCGIGRHKACTLGAIRVLSNLLAHLLTETCKLVLHLCTTLEI